MRREEKSCLADSQSVVFVVSKNPTHRSDELAGIQSNLTNQTKDPANDSSGIDQQSKESDCEIQDPKRGIHRLSAVRALIPE
jgi:hypothetical protein